MVPPSSAFKQRTSKGPCASARIGVSLSELHPRIIYSALKFCSFLSQHACLEKKAGSSVLAWCHVNQPVGLLTKCQPRPDLLSLAVTAFQHRPS